MIRLVGRVKSGVDQHTKLSAIFLIGANLIPVVGVLAWDWSVLDVVVLYWAENVVLGFINIFRLAFAGVGGKKTETEPGCLKLFLIPFFCVHYGFFCFGHGLFIFSLLSDRHTMGNPFRDAADLFGQTSASMWGFVALFASHVFSFFWNYVGKREYRETSSVIQMFAPYGRIIVLHIAILFGAFVIQFFGSPIWMLILLVIGKTLMDLGLHFASHMKKSEKPN